MSNPEYYKIKKPLKIATKQGIVILNKNTIVVFIGLSTLRMFSQYDWYTYKSITSEFEFDIASHRQKEFLKPIKRIPKILKLLYE